MDRNHGGHADRPRAPTVHEAMMESNIRYCLHFAWPYTEHNMCILLKNHDGNHMDDKGREFDAVRYIKD
jgi:hypothetical protein